MRNSVITMRYTRPLSPTVRLQQRFFTLLIMLGTACIVYEGCMLIYDRILHNATDVRCRRHQEVQRTNLQIRRVYMKEPFLDWRLAPINYTIVPRDSLCSGVDFLVVVHVRAEDSSTREIWRNTYGNGHLRNQFNYSILFSNGMPSDSNDQRRIEEESSLHGDILQADFKDTYRNLTLKHLAELRYLALTCDEDVVLLKFDDDVGWDVKRFFLFMKNNCSTDNLYCSRRQNFRPFRDPRLRWAVTKEEWNDTMYPSYCPGWCYIVTLPAVKRMLRVAHAQRFFWIDDVFITGVLREPANVSITNMDTISGDTQYPKDYPQKKNAFLTKKEHVRYWFFAINHERLSLNSKPDYLAPD